MTYQIVDVDIPNLDAIVEEVHRAYDSGNTTTRPNPHYVGPRIPEALLQRLVTVARERNTTPDDLLAAALNEYLRSA